MTAKKITVFILGIIILGTAIVFTTRNIGDHLDNYCINRIAHSKSIGKFCRPRISKIFYDNQNHHKKFLALENAKTIWADNNGYIVSIEYEDSYGNTTMREINITQVKQSNSEKIYLLAYCFDKKDERIFRLDRVKEFYNQNGDPIPTNEVLKTLNIKK